MLSLFAEHKNSLGKLSIPTHTMESLDNYFLRGFPPGGFVTCILTNDLYHAVRSADHANRHAIYEITEWLLNEGKLLNNSFGTRENVKNWLEDKNNIRTTWVEKLEKEYIWETLKE